MSANRDPQRRPVWIDRVNNRLLAAPVGAGPWPVVNLDLSALGLDLSALGSAAANTWVGRYGTSGPLQSYSADVAIDLINAATTKVIAAARVTAGSTSGAGVLQLTDGTSSTSTTTAATPNAVKSAYDLATSASNTANAALPKAGGTMTGAIAFAAGQAISGYGLLDGTQSWTKAQRGAVVSLNCAASVAPDFAAGNHFSCLLNQAMQLAAPTNAVAGQSGVIELLQPANGSTYSVSYASAWKFIGDTPAVATTNGAINALAYYVKSGSEILAELRAGY